MSRRGALLFAAMCVIWGVPYLMIRVAVRELAPVTLVFFRTALGALLLTPLALVVSALVWKSCLVEARGAAIVRPPIIFSSCFKTHVSRRDINIARSRITMPAILNQCGSQNAKRKSSSTIFS